MKNRHLLPLAAAALGLAFATAAFAQETPRVDRREANQEKRIDKGVESGAFNQKEAARLDGREAKLEADEAAAKADGKVTKKERARLNREANRNSRKIHRQKHDAQTAAPANPQ